MGRTLVILAAALSAVAAYVLLLYLVTVVGPRHRRPGRRDQGLVGDYAAVGAGRVETVGCWSIEELEAALADRHVYSRHERDLPDGRRQHYAYVRRR